MTKDVNGRRETSVPPGPWGGASVPAPPRREPAIHLPLGVGIVLLSILGGYFLQTLAPDPETPVAWLGLSKQGLAAGRWWTPASVMIVHGSWAHAGLNALGALAFGPPVARRLGLGAAGLAHFLAFYVVCGVLASLGYLIVRWGGTEVLIGASGAVSGLMGASSRLLDAGAGRDARGLAPFASRTVVAMAAAWGFINLLMAMGWLAMGAEGPIAWQAHLVGYAAGLLLIGPFAQLSPSAEISLQHPHV